MSISAPGKQANDYNVKPRVKSPGTRDPVTAPETVRTVLCALCNSTGHIWVQCRDAGPVKIRCTCGTKRIADGFMELRITALVALFFVIVMLGVLYFLGRPSPIF